MNTFRAVLFSGLYFAIGFWPAVVGLPEKEPLLTAVLALWIALPLAFIAGCAAALIVFVPPSYLVDALPWIGVRGRFCVLVALSWALMYALYSYSAPQLPEQFRISGSLEAAFLLGLAPVFAGLRYLWPARA